MREVLLVYPGPLLTFFVITVFGISPVDIRTLSKAKIPKNTNKSKRLSSVITKYY